MPASAPIQEIHNRLRVAKILWFSLMTTVIVYALVLYLSVQPGRGDAAPVAPLDPANLLTYALSGVIVFAAFRVSDLLVSRERLAKALAQPWTAESLGAEISENGPRYTPERAAALAEAPEDQRRTIQVMTPYFMFCIVRYAMFDAAALLGFIRAFLGQSPGVYLPSGLIALVGFLLSIPSEEAVVKLARRAAGSSLT